MAMNQTIGQPDDPSWGATDKFSGAKVWRNVPVLFNAPSGSIQTNDAAGLGNEP